MTFFCFTMLQEMVARIMSVDLGIYKLAWEACIFTIPTSPRRTRSVQEGWQSTKSAMPPMPNGDPRPAITLLLKAEATSAEEPTTIQKRRAETAINPYWADLIRLLKYIQLWATPQQGNLDTARKNGNASPIYDTYIQRILENTAKR